MTVYIKKPSRSRATELKYDVLRLYTMPYCFDRIEKYNDQGECYRITYGNKIAHYRLTRNYPYTLISGCDLQLNIHHYNRLNSCRNDLLYLEILYRIIVINKINLDCFDINKYIKLLYFTLIDFSIFIKK